MEEYLVVGIQKEYNKSMLVMQALLPDYLPVKERIFTSKYFFLWDISVQSNVVLNPTNRSEKKWGKQDTKL